MNLFKRILSIVLVATFMLSAFASCANKDNNNTKRPAATGGAVTDASGNVVFEEADFNGEEFKILYYGETSKDFYDRYIWSEGFTGEAIGDAVKERNQLVEDKYNVVITAEECGPMGEATNRIQAGQVDFNLIYERGVRCPGAALDGMLYDFHELNYVNFDQSYWVPSAIDGLTVADRMFVATNMITMNSLSWANIYYFNKMIMDELQLTYPYDYVDQKNWTYDVVLDMVTKAEYDVNGDGIMGTEDRFGGISGDEIIQGMCDAPLYEVVDDEYKIVTFTEGMVAAYNTYKSKCDAIEYVDWEDYVEGQDISGFGSQFIAARFLSFGEDHQLFMGGAASIDMTREFVDMKNDYGIVPRPTKNAGDEFVTGVDYCAPMFAVPVSVKDADMTGMILEYMAYESERLLLPAYYETTIKTKRMQDTRDYTMLDIIRGSITYDWTGIYLYAGYKINAMRPAMLESGNFASVAKKYGPAAQKEIDDIISTLEGIG